MYSLLKRFLTSVLSVGGGVGSSYLIGHLVTPKTIHQKLVGHGYDPLDPNKEEDGNNQKIIEKIKKEAGQAKCQDLYEKKLSEDTDNQYGNQAIQLCVKNKSKEGEN